MGWILFFLRAITAFVKILQLLNCIPAFKKKSWLIACNTWWRIIWVIKVSGRKPYFLPLWNTHFWNHGLLMLPLHWPHFCVDSFTPLESHVRWPQSQLVPQSESSFISYPCTFLPCPVQCLPGFRSYYLYLESLLLNFLSYVNSHLISVILTFKVS